MAFFPVAKPTIRVVGAKPRAVKPKEVKPSGDTQVVLDAFTELAPQYEATMNRELQSFWGISYQEFVDRFIATIPFREGARLLDVATGTAMIPLQVTRRTPGIAYVVGLDITPAMLAHGQENVRSADESSRIRLVCGSGMVMPFGSKSFDVITCGLGMHHMDADQLVRQMKRVLSPSGWLLMADVGAAPIWRSSIGKLGLAALFLRFGLRYSRVRIQAEMDALTNMRTASEWRAFLAAAGFTDIIITEMPGLYRFHPVALLVKARIRPA
jgi:ubiquinone/menaquinone biosynthesis C-methylase UbiE